MQSFNPSPIPGLPLQMAEILESQSPEVDQYLGEQIYVSHDPEHLAKQRSRLAKTLRAHAQRVGNKPTYILRAPGRLNAFLEYLDMCTGDHMSTTIDGDIPVAVSPREDDVLDVANFNPLFQPDTLSLATEFERFAKAPWGKHAEELEDNWDNRSLIYPYAGRPQGHWLNYVLSPYMRIMWELPEIMLRGADITFGEATAPFRAGTSSSSAVVVLSFLALYLSNKDQLPDWEIKDVCKLLGEAEWYVGTHGGANDQTTILSNPANCVLYNRHSRTELVSTPLPFLRGVHVVLANSLWEVNKTKEGNQSFNMRKGWMQMGDELMKLVIGEVMQSIAAGATGQEGWLTDLVTSKFRFTPGCKPTILESRLDYWELINKNYKRFGSLCEDILGIPVDAINELVMLMPVKITPEDAGKILGKDSFSIKRTYGVPKRDIGGYHVRTTARFFLKENVIGRTLERIFLEAEGKLTSGELELDSPEYDAFRLQVGRLVDALQDALCFDFRVSIPQLDVLLTIARRGPGYLGGKLTGAGKGGCVSILVRADQSAQMCEYLDDNYYGKSELFEMYRQVLEDECKVCQPGTAEYDSAEERLQILNAALANSKDQRRVITFSKGACALELPGMQECRTDV